MSNQFVGNKTPVLCNQENVIMRGNCYKIVKALEGYHVIIKPAVKDSHDKGRAKNGMFVAVPNSIKNQIIDVSPVFWRIQAVLLTCRSSKILIINSYFPVDRRTENVRGGGELLKHTIEV